jgi:vitamin B12 transporter
MGATYNRGVYAAPHDAWTRDASVRLDVTPATAWHLTGLFRYVDIESNLPVRDPGATRVPLDPNARNTRERLVGSAEAAFQATPTWSHRLRISAYREDFFYSDMFDDVASTGDYDFFIFDANFSLESRLWRVAGSYTGTNTFAIGHGRHAVSLSYGAGAEREDLRDRTAGDFGNDTLLLDRVSGSGLAEAQLRIGERFRAVAGLRVDAYEGIDAAWSPRATATADLVPGLFRVRGGAGRAFKAPNLQQQYLDNPFILSNPDLVPETSTSWEVGAGLTTRGGAGSLELTFFQQRVTDMIQLAPSGDSTRLQYRNLSETRVGGFEATGRIRPHRAWLAGLDATWLSTELVDNAGLDGGAFPSDSALPYRPDLVAGAFVEWSPTTRLTVRGRARYVGRQVALTERFSGSRASLDPYVLIGLNASARLPAFGSVYLRVDNLFSKYYEPGYATPGAARSVALGLRVPN